MAIHNWVRCHWRNGRHDLHDLPDEWQSVLDAHLSKQRTRADDLGVVRIASVDALAVAWVECEVPLGAGEHGFTYRRARAIHALVRPMASGGAWETHEVESLLGRHYGEPVAQGLAAQHRALSTLTFPEDGAKALGLFVGRNDPLPSERALAGPAAGDSVSAEVQPPSDGPVACAAPALAATDVRCETRPAPVSVPALDRWMERFTLRSRRSTAPDCDAVEESAVTKVSTEPHEEEAVARGADAPLETRPALPALPSLPSLPSPDAPDALAEEPAVDAEDESKDGPEPLDQDAAQEEAEVAPLALFDLSTRRSDLPEAPPSSLSGLLGPSHTTPC